MAEITTFAPRSEPVCCATCRRWTARRDPDDVRDIFAWCPVRESWLPEDLTTCACGHWQRETIETSAVELWRALTTQTAARPTDGDANRD